MNMAYARHYDSRDSRSYGHTSAVNLQERERKKKKREQQFEAKEKTEPKPIFSQPRKISTSHQSPLARKIKSLLPDPDSVELILNSESPNKLFGVSRSQSTLTPATPLEQESSEPPLGQSQSYHSSRGFSSSNHKKSSQGRSDHRGSSERSHNSSSSREDYSRHYSGSRTKHGSVPRESPGHAKSVSSSAYSSGNTSTKSSSSYNSVNMDTTITNDSALPDDDVLNDDAFPLGLKHPGKFSDRSRMSSVDSDYAVGVEKIFEIMKIPPEPLTAIQTPSSGHEEAFNFDKHLRRKDFDIAHDSDAGSSTLGKDKLMSDTDSSDDSSDEEDEQKPTGNKWLLGGSVEEPVKSTERKHEAKKRESERVKSKQHLSSDSKHNVNSRKDSRGRDIVKKSRSTVHSSTSSHRSESSDRGSVTSQSKSQRSEPQRHKVQRLSDKKPASPPTYEKSNHSRGSSPGLSSVSSGAPSYQQKKNNPHQFVAKKGINNSIKNPHYHHSADDSESEFPSNDARESDSSGDSSAHNSESSSSESESEDEGVNKKAKWVLASKPKEQNTLSSNNNNTVKHKDNINVKKFDEKTTSNFEPASNSINHFLQSNNFNHSDVEKNVTSPTRSFQRPDNKPKRPNDINNSSKVKKKLGSPSTNSIFHTLSMKLHCYLFDKDTEKKLNFANTSRTNKSNEPVPTVSQCAKFDNRAAGTNVSPQHMPTISTGSETDQPLRRANTYTVQIADADGSKVWPDSTSTNKRKHQAGNDNEQYNNNDNHSKRRKQSPTENRNHLSPESWRHKKQSESSHARNSDSRLSPHKSNQTPNSQRSNSSRHQSPTSENKQLCHTNKSSATPGVAAIVPEPDSSWPEQERLQTADQYMCEGKRLKHEGDGLTDSRTGKTRPGMHHRRALAYFEAALCFIMTGYVMEIENNADRSDSGSNSGSSSTSHSPSNMYLQTVQLLDYVLKMMPRAEPDITFKRLQLSCHRCQSVLYFRIYKLKKDLALKYSEVLNDQFKSTKSNRTPSPWHQTHSTTHTHVLSPMSPAVQSPFAITTGPSPIGFNNSISEVSSSTQPGKMTPTHNSVVIPQKTYDIFKQHHVITSNLLKAHEKWDQAAQLNEDHKDFFRNIDTLCSRTLTFHSSLRDIVIYNRVVLHQLRAATAVSPREFHT